MFDVCQQRSVRKIKSRHNLNSQTWSSRWDIAAVVGGNSVQEVLLWIGGKGEATATLLTWDRGRQHCCCWHVSPKSLLSYSGMHVSKATAAKCYRGFMTVCHQCHHQLTSHTGECVITPWWSQQQYITIGEMEDNDTGHRGSSQREWLIIVAIGASRVVSSPLHGIDRNHHQIDRDSFVLQKHKL